RVRDLDASPPFFCTLLGLAEVRRRDNAAGRFTLVFLAPPGDPDRGNIGLTWNWDDETYAGGRNFGRLAHQVADRHALGGHLPDPGVTVIRPPRVGHAAFGRSPDGIPLELMQKGAPLPPAEPGTPLPNTGTW